MTGRTVTRLLAGVATALAFSCSDPVDVQHGTLTIDLRTGGSFVWPRGGDTRITILNELDDQRGFAGFELDIAGTSFTARNFTTDEPPRFNVPDTGRIAFTVRLVQDGRIVAGGSEGWMLEPEAEWRLEVNRAPYPPSEGFNRFGDPHPQCSWFWCWENWRFPITEEAANYEHEALWLTLYREDICADICP